MSPARDAVEEKDFRDQRRELDEKEFWNDVDDWSARVDACVVPENPQNAETDNRSFQ
jgi:transcription elongation factor Elf1